MQRDPAIAVVTSEEVYPPSEDSYLLLDAVRVEPGECFLEVGTGTGLLALHAARVTRAVATDLNPSAVRLARRNAAAHGLPVSLVRTDLLRGLRGPFDVVAFNPPYLEGIPTNDSDRAWQGGDQGSEVALRFLDELPRVLAPEGRAYLILSEGNRPAHSRARERFLVRTLGTMPLFFERLHVVELRRKP